MIEENLQNEAEIRRFLLGEMIADERAAFEENFIADENLFEAMRVVEDELIESYVRGTLSAREKERFERSFLATEPRRRRVAFARTMFGKLSEQQEIAVAQNAAAGSENSSFWHSMANLFKTPKFAFGAAFALLILFFGGWLLLKNPNQTEIVRQTTTTPTIPVEQSNQNSMLDQTNLPNVNADIADKNIVNKNASTNANRESPNKNQKPNQPKSNAVGYAPVLALFAGSVRATGKMPQLNLQKNAPGVNLQLNLESQDYKVYSVEIVDPDGKPIFRNDKLIAGNSKINFFVPAAKLRRGDYMIKLSALNPRNESESIADYAFRVAEK